MSTEDFDLDRRLESIKATAIKFVEEMDETVIVAGGMSVAGRPECGATKTMRTAVDPT